MRCSRRGDRGFILPMAILLVVFIAVSGMSFMQLDFLERRMAGNEVDNHAAFYLANAGIERAREVLKITLNPLNWSDVLAGTKAGYSVDGTPDPRLCPDALNRGCSILPFGGAVTSPDNLAFSGVFSRGEYRVRAYNNAGDPGLLQDTDELLTIRALGTIPITGQTKVLEMTVFASSGMNLINCATGTDCPNRVNGNPTINPADGREPSVGPVPTPSIALTNPNNYYRQSSNFPGLTVREFTGAVQDDSYYLIIGDATIQNVAGDNIVIVATGNLTIKTQTTLTRAVLVGVNSVMLQGNGMIVAPSPYPAIVSGGNVTKSSGSATVYGAIYAGGTVDFNPIDIHGVIMGNQVKIQGSSIYTDDHDTDPNFTRYYELMPGFDYPNELITAAIQSGSWREIQ